MAATAYGKTEGQVERLGSAAGCWTYGDESMPCCPHGPLDPVKTIGCSPWQPPHTVKQKVKLSAWGVRRGAGPTGMKVCPAATWATGPRKNHRILTMAATAYHKTEGQAERLGSAAGCWTQGDEKYALLPPWAT